MTGGWFYDIVGSPHYLKYFSTDNHQAYGIAISPRKYGGSDIIRFSTPGFTLWEHHLKGYCISSGSCFCWEDQAQNSLEFENPWGATTMGISLGFLHQLNVHGRD